MSSNTFRAGQIVPRRLRLVLSVDRKSQHAITFGCDVSIVAGEITPLTSGCILQVAAKTRRMANGTYRRREFCMMGLTANNTNKLPRVTFMRIDGGVNMATSKGTWELRGFHRPAATFCDSVETYTFAFTDLESNV